MICPIIGLLLLAIVGWLTVSGLKIRELSRAPAIACGRCGHFLSAGQLQCPECGTTWTVDWLSRLSLARARSWRLRLVIASILGALLLGAVLISLSAFMHEMRQAKATKIPSSDRPSTGESLGRSPPLKPTA